MATVRYWLFALGLASLVVASCGRGESTPTSAPAILPTPTASPTPTTKVFDPTQETVLIGRALSGNMVIQLELEPAKAMLMQMGSPPMWMEQSVGAGEPYHVEVKPIDTVSGARIPLARVMFSATNQDSGRKVEGMLHPMWGGSGLHYAMNSGLTGDGTYQATVTVEPPAFGRALKDKEMWMRPATAVFTFTLAKGQVTQLSTATAEVPPSKEAVKAPGTPPELPADPSQGTVFVGSRQAGGMIVQLELEPAKAMLMQMGSPPMWMEERLEPGQLYHVEVKPADPTSSTRVSHAQVMFAAVNRDNGRMVEGMLHPMWGGSGLHYAMNSGLAGDGTYEATVTVEPPTFTRATKDKDLWMQPVTVTFTFRLSEGKVTEAR